MIRPLMLLLAVLPVLAAEPPAGDLLRLTNGELEGRFSGLSKDGILSWEREDGVAPLEFRTDKVRQIILRGGRALDAGNDASHIALTNGDRIPGRLVGLDNDQLTLETPMAGTLMLPRSSLASVSPNPFGGRLIYAGPFSSEGWEIYQPPNDEAVEQLESELPPAVDEAEPGEAPPSWYHSGSRWYYTAGEPALRLNSAMPDQSILRFKLEWRNRPPIAIAFNADFKGPPDPPAAEDAGDAALEGVRRLSSQNLADLFGNAYVLTIRGNYAGLQHCGYTSEGQATIDQIRSTSSSVRFDDSGEAVFEIRTDLRKGLISLFINGGFSMNWDTGRGLDDLPPAGEDGSRLAPPQGGGIGFKMMGGESPVRISDIIIAEWNGMPDSARSMDSEDHDVVLLTNGTDRFSGAVTSIRDGRLVFQSSYAPLDIPLGEVAEIRFAGKNRSKAAESRDREIRVHFQPLGRLTGLPSVAANGRIQLDSAVLGKLDVDLTPAVILEFQSGSAFLNYWDEDL